MTSQSRLGRQGGGDRAPALVGMPGESGTASLLLADEAASLRLDATDPVASCRAAFEMPRTLAGTEEVIYLAGNSLGLQPKDVRPAILQELDQWAKRGLAGQRSGPRAWEQYPQLARATSARLIGAIPGESVLMSSLTVNLHLLMTTFYRPTRERHRILIEDHAFPSDDYAVAAQAELHGLDRNEAVVRVSPRPGEEVLRNEDIIALLEREGESIALVLLGAVNYLTGELLDIGEITRRARAAGCVVGWDLAHAAGNVPLRLHEDGVDFAAWCSYKYLNSGPGAVGGLFVHERHWGSSAPRLAGWWGHRAESRFDMPKHFVPERNADGWQVSNPAILSMTPVRVSLELFDRIGIGRLRERSMRLTAYLEQLVDELAANRPIDVITPRDPLRRGCQLSLQIGQPVAHLARQLEARGVLCDWRNPDVLRVAPTPLYNTFHELWRFIQLLQVLIPETL